MTPEQFYILILQVEKNGYKEHLKMLPIMPICPSSADLLAQKIFWQKRYEIIFSIEFAKSLWGKKMRETNEKTGEFRRRDVFKKIQNYEYHLQQMVLEENPLKYLEKF